MKILKFGKRQALKMIISVTLLFFLALGPISSVYAQDGVQTGVEDYGPVVVSTGKLNVRVVYETVPHFWYWSADGDQEEAYHVMFLQLIEYNDSDGDETFDENERTPYASTDASTYALSGGNWKFSGFTDGDGNEIAPGTKADSILFSFTLVGPRRGDGGDQETGTPTQPPEEPPTQPPEEPPTPTSTQTTSDNLKIVLTCHITSDEAENNKMKIDVYIENWNFASSNNRLALRTDFSSDKADADIIVQSNGYQIGEAFFSFVDEAVADGNTEDPVPVNVKSNYEFKTEETDSEETEETGLKVWFNYPAFTTSLKHDPTIGIGDLSAETGLLGGFGDGTGTEILSSPLVIGISTVVVTALIVGIIYIGKRR